MTPSDEQLPSAETISRGYEGDDLSNRGLLVFVIAFICSVAAVQGGVWVLAEHYLWSPRAEDRAPSSVNLVEHYPSPQLQPSVGHNMTPEEDLAAMRHDEGQVFDALGWKRDEQSRNRVIPDGIVAELKQREAATQPAKAGAK